MKKEKDSQALPIKSKFPHELHALETITQSLKNQAEFVPNYDLYDPATNQYFECDLIAIAGDLIAIIEVKHWAGKVEILPHNWRINGKYRKDPHKSNKYKCQVLRSFIDKAFHSHGYVKEGFRGIIKTYERIGTYNASDDKKVDIIVVYLQKGFSLDHALCPIFLDISEIQE